MRWPLWAPVVMGWGKLIEVQTQWSINDLADAHEVMVTRADLEQYIAKRVRKRAEANKG